MEENWGRRNEVKVLDQATLQEILKPVAGKRKVTGWELLTSGKANTSYRVILAGQLEPVLLKLHIRDHASCRKEYNLYQKLHDRVPLAEILYFESSPAAFGFPYSLIRWVEGRHLDRVLAGQDDIAVEQVAFEVGQTLARLGEYPFEQPGLLDADLNVAIPFDSTALSWSSFILQRCLVGDAVGRHLGKAWATRLARLVEDNTSFVAGLTGRSVLVHGDFKGPNILVRETGTGRVAAVLDWEFAYAGSPLSDVGQVLRHQACFNPVFKPAFAAGYEQYGPKLPDEWEKAARLLDLLNLCDFLNRPDPDPTLKEEVVRLITGTIAAYGS